MPKEQELVWPCESVAMQMTGVVPGAKGDPLGGVQVILVIVPQEVVAVGGAYWTWLVSHVLTKAPVLGQTMVTMLFEHNWNILHLPALSAAQRDVISLVVRARLKSSSSSTPV